MLQKRLAAAIDEDISKTQLGFRKTKSMAIPIACIRRLLDEAEATNKNVVYHLFGLGKSF